jgi:PAS domain S-box-containing protein
VNSEDKYRLIFERFSDGILVIHNGYIVFLNPIILELTGFTWNDLTVRPVIKFVHPDDKEAITLECEKIQKGNKYSYKDAFRILTKDRRVKWVRIKADKITWDEKPATLIFVTDVTNQKEKEIS